MNKELDIKFLKFKIGENLFRIRREKGLSLYTASELLGIKRSQLDWLERGSGCMNLSKLISLSNSYKIDISELFK